MLGLWPRGRGRGRGVVKRHTLVTRRIEDVDEVEGRVDERSRGVARFHWRVIRVSDWVSIV